MSFASYDRLRHEYETMLANLTATQKRCTEQEQKIRDQERELVELRGKQGAEELHDEPPLFQVYIGDEHHSDHDGEWSADRDARGMAGELPEGTIRVVEVRTEYVVEPARDRTVTKKRLGPNYITED